MAYRQVTKEELDKYIASNPGAKYRVNGQEVSAPIGDEDQSGIMRLLTSLSKPLRTVPGSIYSAITGDTQGDNPFLTKREELSYAEDPTKFGTKSAAGLASYLIPGGSTAGTAGARIAGAAVKGAGAGALGGFGASKDDKELESILKGAGLGGLLGGGMQAAGEGIKALQSANLSKQAEKLGKAADDLEVNSYTKKIGTKPTMKQGKYDLARDSLGLAKAEGKVINSADELSSFSDELFSKYGGTADKYAQQFDMAGGAISVDKIKAPLLEDLANARTPQIKAPLEKVLASIDEAAGGANTIGAEDLLNLRREWGSLGNWNQFTPAKEQAIASAWEKAYNSANDVLDSSFKGTGLNDFRDVNKVLKTAIDQKNWARKAAATRAGSPVWTDMTQDAAMFGNMLAGGPGAVATTLGSKFLQKNGENIASQGLRGVSNALGGVGSTDLSAIQGLLGTAGQGTQRVAPAITGQLAAQSQPMTQGMSPETVLQQPQSSSMGGMSSQEIQALKSYFASAVMSGQMSMTEADGVLKLLGIDEEAGGASTEGQRDYQLAAESLKDAYNLIDEGAGKLPTLGGNIAGFFGSTTGSSEYRASLDTALAFLRKALIGSGQSEAELKNLNLPKPTDEPAIAKQKIEALIPLLYGRAGVQNY